MTRLIAILCLAAIAGCGETKQTKTLRNPSQVVGEDVDCILIEEEPRKLKLKPIIIHYGNNPDMNDMRNPDIKSQESPHHEQ